MFGDRRDPRHIAKTVIEAGDAAKIAGCLRQMADTLADLQGNGLKPQRGSHFLQTGLGETTVIVEYDFHRSEAPIYDPDHPGCGPGHPEWVDLLNVYINGLWVSDVMDHFSDATLEVWGEECLKAQGEEA